MFVSISIVVDYSMKIYSQDWFLIGFCASVVFQKKKLYLSAARTMHLVSFCDTAHPFYSTGYKLLLLYFLFLLVVLLLISLASPSRYKVGRIEQMESAAQAKTRGPNSVSLPLPLFFGCPFRTCVVNTLKVSPPMYYILNNILIYLVQML